MLNFEKKDLPNFHGGNGIFRADMFADDKNKILKGVLEPGCSIGLHCHETSSEVIYVLSGEGTMILEGQEQRLKAGNVHYCKKGQSHTFINDTNENLVFFAVVPQQ